MALVFFTNPFQLVSRQAFELGHAPAAKNPISPSRLWYERLVRTCGYFAIACAAAVCQAVVRGACSPHPHMRPQSPPHRGSRGKPATRR